ncbi:hypothetical protein Tco_1354909 [Tanacetum coccineum]
MNDDIEEMDIKWNLALLSMRVDRFWKKTGKKITIQGSDVAGFDKSKVECFNCHRWVSKIAKRYAHKLWMSNVSDDSDQVDEQEKKRLLSPDRKSPIQPRVEMVKLGEGGYALKTNKLVISSPCLNQHKDWLVQEGPGISNRGWLVMFAKNHMVFNSPNVSSTERERVFKLDMDRHHSGGQRTDTPELMANEGQEQSSKGPKVKFKVIYAVTDVLKKLEVH